PTASEPAVIQAPPAAAGSNRLTANPLTDWAMAAAGPRANEPAMPRQTNPSREITVLISAGAGPSGAQPPARGGARWAALSAPPTSTLARPERSPSDHIYGNSPSR